MDEDLTWNLQLDQTKRKLSRICGLLAKLRYFVKTDLLRIQWRLIFAIIYVVIDYDFE